MGAPTFLELARSIDRTLAGNINFPFRALVDGASSVTDNDFYLTVDADLGDATLTLPSAVTVKKGLGFRVMRIDDTLSNTVTIATTGGQTINGAASGSISLQYSVLDIVSNGTNWLLFASPAAYVLATDVLWSFPGTISTDQNSNLYTLVAKRSLAFVGVDGELNVASAGADVIIDWEINGIVDVSLTTTIAAGTRYSETLFQFALAVDDTLHPIITQVGAQTPGLTLIMRARGQ